MAPFLSVVKWQNFSKIRVTILTPRMPNFKIDGSTKPQIFAKIRIFFEEF
jgi:hypothetical protein